MRISVLGFNQQKIVEINRQQTKYKIDTNDLLLLDYIWQAQAQPSMKHITRENISYVWLKHSKIMEDLPVLDIKLSMLGKRLKKLEELNLIVSKKLSNDLSKGSRTYYAITDMCEQLKFIEELSSVKNYSCSDGPSVKNYSCSDGPSVKNYSSNNILDNNKKLKEDNKEHTSKKLIPASKDSFKDVQEVIDYYKQTCINLPQPRVINTDRKKLVRNILTTYGIQVVKEVIDKTANSSFLNGSGSTGWTADFNWIFKEKNFIKILEGNYTDRKSTNKKSNMFSEAGGKVKSVPIDRKKKEKYLEELRKNGERVEY